MRFVSCYGRLVKILALVLALLGSGFLTEARAELVKLGQATSTSLTFGPIYASIELGYFKEEDIKLEILEFQGASVLLPQVANGSVTIGFPGPDPLIISHQPGRDPIPLKFFYNGARDGHVRVRQSTYTDDFAFKVGQRL